MKTYNILILGSGGREHSFAWKISKSPLLNKLYVAPGNAGTAAIAHNIDFSVNDFNAIKQFVLSNSIDIVLVGPEDPLVNGIQNFFKADNELAKVQLIGPCKEGAKLEGSKSWSKAFMQKNNIPTAAYKSFNSTELDDAIQFLKELTPPYVIKADGLAAGKGVIITSELSEAENTLKEMFGGKFGDAGSNVVIEEFLNGVELSVFILTDGNSYVLLPEAKDYKRIGNNNTGPNTGGMGAVSPVPFADNAFMEKVKNQVIIPTLNGLKSESIIYNGFIFFGLINVNNNPYVIEYNVRMGDPETIPVMLRLNNDLVDLFIKLQSNELNKVDISIKNDYALTLVVTSQGYPNDYKKGLPITFSETDKSVTLLHSGTKIDNGKCITAGGRVFTITAVADSISNARKLSYDNVKKQCFEGMYYRNDIGNDLII